MKPSDFQKTVQCRFESCLKKVVRHVVKDYQKKLKRRQKEETLFCELPEIVVENLAVWDDYDTDYTIFNVCGNDIRVYDDELAEALKQLSDRYVCEIASHGDCTPRPFQKKASDPRSDPRATVGKVVLPRPILTE